jgi:DNA (cytosine-5)-methyltransferase 1
MTTYYNEINPHAAQWLRNLINAGHIAAGDVDERSIVDVRPGDLKGYTQCHFFAGIGGWSYALRLAGWSDDESVWTGSCPCPPFSAAGKRVSCPACSRRLLVWCPRRTGFAICADCGHAWLADGRHLWPEFWRLVAERRPPTIFGEQVASEEGLVWLAAVRGGLEILRYDVGASDLPACGVGAPHVRQRLWWMANDARQRCQQRRENASGSRERTNAPQKRSRPRECGDVGMVHRELEHANAPGLPLCEQDLLCGAWRSTERRAIEQPSHSPWANLEWLKCTDGKTRPTQPGLFPLADGVPARVGRLRAYGNAIVPQVAAAFIGTGIEVSENLDL